METGREYELLHEEAAGRIAGFVDAASFIELSPLAMAGVATGYGTIDSRLVYIYCQYGAINTRHADKVAYIYSLAAKMGAPVIALLNSPGAELSSGVELMSAYGKVFAGMASLRGVAPQVSVVLGGCLGMASMIPMLSDFVIMLRSHASLALQSPAAIQDPSAKDITLEEIAGGEHHFKATGIAHILADDEANAAASLKSLISFLPANNLDEPQPYAQYDDINRTCPDIACGTYICDIIRAVADNNNLLELGQAYTEQVTGFARFNGYTAGIVAFDRPISLGGAQKATYFMSLCDAYNIPIVTLSTSSGYDYTIANHGNMLKAASSLLSTYASADTPKVSLICGESYGASAVTYSKHGGADICYAWEGAGIALMNPENSAKVLGFAMDGSPEESEKMGFIDNVIEPRNTRKMIISALEMLASKRVVKNTKKHSSRAR
ncbi:MAG: hypothetical protein FWD96_05385 [Defluviitaleaceae bacterium]|nr:hypothetical protein [Defluviitaleaceae bacterium]